MQTWGSERMRVRTKMRLKFYLSLAGLVVLTLLIGVLFQYLAWLTWRIRLGDMTIKYEVFMAMAAALFIMCVTDIVLFFRLILKKQYW